MDKQKTMYGQYSGQQPQSYFAPKSLPVSQMASQANSPNTKKHLLTSKQQLGPSIKQQALSMQTSPQKVKSNLSQMPSFH